MEEENATTFGIYSAFITGVFATNDELEEMDEALQTPHTLRIQSTFSMAEMLSSLIQLLTGFSQSVSLLPIEHLEGKRPMNTKKLRS